MSLFAFFNSIRKSPTFKEDNKDDFTDYKYFILITDFWTNLKGTVLKKQHFILCLSPAKPITVFLQDGRVRVVSDRGKEGVMLSESLAVLLTSSTWCSWHGGHTERSRSAQQSFKSWTAQVRFLQIAYSDATNTVIYFKNSKRMFFLKMFRSNASSIRTGLPFCQIHYQ